MFTLTPHILCLDAAIGHDYQFSFPFRVNIRMFRFELKMNVSTERGNGLTAWASYAAIGMPHKSIRTPYSSAWIVKTKLKSVKRNRRAARAQSVTDLWYKVNANCTVAAGTKHLCVVVCAPRPEREMCENNRLQWNRLMSFDVRMMDVVHVRWWQFVKNWKWIWRDRRCVIKVWNSLHWNAKQAHLRRIENNAAIRVRKLFARIARQMKSQFCQSADNGTASPLSFISQFLSVALCLRSIAAAGLTTVDRNNNYRTLFTIHHLHSWYDFYCREMFESSNGHAACGR